MTNPKGVNQWGEKKYPSDEELQDFFLSLTGQSLTVEEKRTKFFQLQRQFKIPTVRKPGISPEEAHAAVIKEVDKDINQMNGPLAVKENLKNNGLILISRNKIQEIMHEYAPEGFDHHFPGNLKQKISCKPLTLLGYILKLCAIPDARKAGAISHLYLDLVQEWNGIPIQLTTDKGSEIGWQNTLQSILREFYAPEINTETFPPSLTLKSTHNTVIEGLWHWLRDKTGFNLKDVILRGKHEFIFCAHIQWHHDLFYWIFVPLIQQELDKFVMYWNNHKIRKQKDKMMPSSHIPDDALHHPSLHGGEPCLIQVPQDAQAELRTILSEEVGRRDVHFSWYSEDFHAYASAVYETLGSPQLSLTNAWNIFALMTHAMAL
ncbi:hypothetical protein P691DRAFT_793250 [Macrolepiota fuliginosa MF-IS2]|uniref:Integrase core domain-containing protein n=1 Tax=Macrolepiota fuliginosa MF-IS2 TaxID=1400762 RepID=A0A9P5WZ13_9AGAR|nr:hypothetical protein P691DRAFT_793250 [Macrolepiota fuliginosa MF-IS2]